jgi:integrase
MATFKKRGDKYFVQIRRKGMATTCRSFHYKADAEEWARHMEAKADRGDLPTPAREQARYTVRDILERYRDEVIPKKRGAEVETYILNAFLRQPLNNLTLAEITPAHFTAYRDKRLKEVAPVTINRELGVIRHAFDTAMREWDMPLRDNPLAKLRKLKVNNARTRRLEPGEWQALEAAATNCRNPLFMHLIRLAVETAMRRGELLAMEWRHINFNQKTLHIPITKNGHARNIPLTSKAVELLQDISSQRHNRPTVFNFTAAAVDSAWDRLIERAAIDDLHFHDLRHESISRFFERGLSVPEVALISGHRDYRMLARYTHIRAEEIAEKLAQEELSTEKCR